MKLPLPFQYELDHIGVAVEHLEEATKAYVALGWTGHHTEEVASEKVRVRMFELVNNCRIELIEPTSEDSTVAKFLKKRGPGLHHICLRVKDIDSVLLELKAKGVQLIHETAFQGAHNCRVAFIHPKALSGVLVELSEPSLEVL